MSERQTIQWFPGHMTKTRRAIAASLKQIDAVAEIVDARIPAASRNPDLAGMTGGKPRLILLNKCDMADPDATAAWVACFQRQGVVALPVDCRSGKGIAAFVPAVRDLLGDLLARRQARGMVGGTLRVMVAGIPNVGKSSFINRLAGSAKARVEDRPGVTRGNQWFAVRGGVDLMDTPGVLWPKFDDQAVARRLAFTGAIRDEILDVEELAVAFLEELPAAARPLLAARYKLPAGWEALPPYEILEQIGRARGMLAARGAVDTERAAVTLLDEFRSAKLGRITLEYPERT